MNDNVILVGFMGTGKTTVGKILAFRLKKKFIDMDDVLEKRAGKAISLVFSEDGEPYFRNMERKLIQELASGRNQVIAAGGGIVLNPDNIADFSRTGKVICLYASAPEILRRVSASSTRPLLEKGNKIRRVRYLLEKRRPLYDAIPCRVDTSELKPEIVADKIMAILKSCP